MPRTLLDNDMKQLNSTDCETEDVEQSTKNRHLIFYIYMNITKMKIVIIDEFGCT